MDARFPGRPSRMTSRKNVSVFSAQTRTFSSIRLYDAKAGGAEQGTAATPLPLRARRIYALRLPSNRPKFAASNDGAIIIAKVYVLARKRKGESLAKAKGYRI